MIKEEMRSETIPEPKRIKVRKGAEGRSQTESRKREEDGHMGVGRSSGQMEGTNLRRFSGFAEGEQVVIVLGEVHVLHTSRVG